MNKAWKQHELDVRDFLGLGMTMREWATTSGVPQPDGDLYSAGTWLDGLHIECKRQQTLRIPEWIRRTEQDADGEYLLVVKRYGTGDVSKSYALTDLATVERWLREGYRGTAGRKPLSRSEAAHYLDVSVATLDKLRFQHGLPYSQPAGHHTKAWFHPDSIDAWVRNNEKTGAA